MGISRFGSRWAINERMFMKILYMSCHIVLEYDEVRLFHDLGHEIFSIGGYCDPRKPHNNMRPPLDFDANQEWLSMFYHMCHQNFLKGVPEGECGKHLTKEFVDNFDCIIVSHRVDWIELNWEVFKSKLIVLRTIGQNTIVNEDNLNYFINKGVKIVRYSPKERDYCNYAGEDAMIRFLKYQTDFKSRCIINKCAITFGQSIKYREKACFGNYIEFVAKKIPFKLYGPENDKYDFDGGFLFYEEQLEKLATNATYFYTGTFPAQYTLNFIEAMLSGIPIVSIGAELTKTHSDPFPFEVPDILDLVRLDLHFNNLNEIVNRLSLLIEDVELNTIISAKQIEVAYELFSAEKNGYKWNDFLNSL